MPKKDANLRKPLLTVGILGARLRAVNAEKVAKRIAVLYFKKIIDYITFLFNGSDLYGIKIIVYLFVCSLARSF